MPGQKEPSEYVPVENQENSKEINKS